MLAGKFVLMPGKLLVAGTFVFITGTLLMADVLVVPPIEPLAPLRIALVVEVPVRLLELFWLQPTNAKAARKVRTDKVMFDFIIWLIHSKRC